SISSNSSLRASAPIFALNEPLPYCSSTSWYSFSFKTWHFSRFVVPLSITTYEAKYMILSKFLGEISSINAILLGIPLKYQICATGAASSICPILSRLTFDFVTSTPHLSHTIPLYLTLLYLPQ